MRYAARGISNGDCNLVICGGTRRMKSRNVKEAIGDVLAIKPRGGEIVKKEEARITYGSSGEAIAAWLMRGSIINTLLPWPWLI